MSLVDGKCLFRSPLGGFIPRGPLTLSPGETGFSFQSGAAPEVLAVQGKSMSL